MKEIWINIKGYKYYQVSNLGRVRSLERKIYRNNNKKPYIVKEKLLSPALFNNGYLFVKLIKDKVGKSFSVHRLVYEAFYGRIPFWMQVNHINEDKTDNRLENLNILTPKANSNWGTHNERISASLKNNPKSCKPILQYDINGTLIKEWISGKEIERALGFKNTDINACCNNKQYRHTAYGYMWKFKD